MFWACRGWVFALVAVAATGVTQTVPGPPVPSLSAVNGLVAQGKLDEALHDLDAMADLRPEPRGVERLRGIVEYEKDHMTEAEASFAKAAAEDPSDLESMQMRGIALFRMGRPADAVPLLEKAHSAGTIANADPNYVLGLCYLITKRYDDARHAFASQYGFPPDSAPAWLVTAKMMFRQEMTGPAADDARKAVELDARLPLAHRLLGEIDLADGDVPGAIAQLEGESALNPLDGETWERLGDAYLRSGQDSRAQQVLDRAVLLEPNATGPYILLGKALLEQQDAVMAAIYLERAAKMDPSNSMTHMLLGRAFAASGRTEDADREFAVLRKLQEAKTAGPSSP
jgi:predicted Zn-dependent protease